MPSLIGRVGLCGPITGRDDRGAPATTARGYSPARRVGPLGPQRSHTALDARGHMMTTSGENKPKATGNVSNGWQVIVAGPRETPRPRRERERYSGRHRRVPADRANAQDATTERGA